jgi:hypothetical protein
MISGDIVHLTLESVGLELKMTGDLVYIPFSRKLYDDIVRFSDGALDPAALAESRVQSWVENSLEFGTDDPWVPERLEELAEIYAPHVLERWLKEDTAQLRQRSENRPLVWKELTIASGSQVRMSYDGEHHYAVVKGGHIVDDGRSYSPSEWASKIAGGTSRNAWRDLWFKELLSKAWVPAQMLRDQAQEEIRRKTRSTDTPEAAS